MRRPPRDQHMPTSPVCDDAEGTKFGVIFVFKIFPVLVILYFGKKNTFSCNSMLSERILTLI